ncbi:MULTISPECIES: YndM family protein [unclassified Cytobacillus]|uniref:YndM family protein n=1 Tax=unclassified Cytobacillus TaxID=2675268 RepID=UPI00203A5C73|nr:YndM family protein [Cytobacillus sp. AMY 15.2]MCM3090977.1 YndM family protein [Cytobacillus sp. AMY 15.2]
MPHGKALALKFIGSLVLLYIILGMIFRMSFINVFLITALLCIISYTLGDMLILPRTGNTFAAAADSGLSFVLIWFLSSILTDGENLLAMSIIAAIGTALFEYFFHKYLAKVMTEASSENKGAQHVSLRYSTEASEEITPLNPEEGREN